MTEDQAVQRCQHGERDAFRYLVERYQDVLFGTAYNMTGNRALAEELAQEAFLSAWKGIRSFRRGRPFKPWLIRILVNAVMAHRRRRSVETTPIEESEWAEDAEHPAGPGRVQIGATDVAAGHQRNWDRSTGRWWCCVTSQI